MKNDFLLSVVVPCFNEEGNIAVLYENLKAVIQQHGWHHEILFIDDGSRDASMDILRALSEDDRCVKYISLSRNFGHQYALKAGLDMSKGDCVISMDADLQHPCEVIPEMIAGWESGYDIVCTVRKDKDVSYFKAAASKLFYRLYNSSSDTPLQYGMADFRLMDRRVVDIICELPERALFLRGLTSWVGFRQLYISYNAKERYSGKSKYSFSKMYSFALNGFTSFSNGLLRASLVAGLCCAFLSFLYGVYALSVYFLTDSAMPGWTSIIASVLFFAGIQLVVLGIIGEYIGKLFIEVKKRPGYLVRETNCLPVKINIKGSEVIAFQPAGKP